MHATRKYKILVRLDMFSRACSTWMYASVREQHMSNMPMQIGHACEEIDAFIGQFASRK